jgi:hypothetical protein
MSDQQQSLFSSSGDINATDINSLTMPPHMSSKNDIGAPGPLEPPIYSPSVDMQQQRRVTFDETPHIQEIPHRADLAADEDRRRVRSRDRDRIRRRDRRSSSKTSKTKKSEKKPKKTRRIVQLASEYAHRAVVAALVLVLLWYHPKIAALPYVGNGYGNLNVLAIVGISIATAGAYGVVESILD